MDPGETQEGRPENLGRQEGTDPYGGRRPTTPPRFPDRSQRCYGYGYGFKLGLYRSPTSLPLV